MSEGEMNLVEDLDHAENHRTLPTDSAARKRIPITSGVLDYFPRAIVAVAEVSVIGNDKHNPGQPLHWAKHKSMDQADCIARHLLERGKRDVDGARHSAHLVWRALAMLEEEIAREEGTWEDEVEACRDGEYPAVMEGRYIDLDHEHISVDESEDINGNPDKIGVFQRTCGELCPTHAKIPPRPKAIDPDGECWNCGEAKEKGYEGMCNCGSKVYP